MKAIRTARKTTLLALVVPVVAVAGFAALVAFLSGSPIVAQEQIPPPTPAPRLDAEQPPALHNQLRQQILTQILTGEEGALSSPGGLLPGGPTQFWERLLGCGFNPPTSALTCLVEKRQPTGYGPAPSGTPEFVRFCVDWDGVGQDPSPGVFDQPGFPPALFGSKESVGEAAVWVKDQAPVRLPGHRVGDPAVSAPPWHYAVEAEIAVPEHLKGSNETRRARAILSWFFEPTHCQYQPSWGQVLNFTIKLGPN
jgi:hypothetical protein